MATTDPFQHDDRLFDTFQFFAEFGQHFVEVYRGYDRTVLGMGTFGSAGDGGSRSSFEA
jgi:hypothetical protein